MPSCSKCSYFNPLPRKEGDPSIGNSGRGCVHFNPLPRKEGDTIFTFCQIKFLYFNPLPRKEGDPLGGFLQKNCLQISIHSLVKRETKYGKDRIYVNFEFQSTPS